jgi:hypothetical protein
MPHGLNELGMQPWIWRIINIALLTFIMKSYTSFLHSLIYIPSLSLQNLSLAIVSDPYVLPTRVCRSISFIYKFFEPVSARYYLGNNNVIPCSDITPARRLAPAYLGRPQIPIWASKGPGDVASVFASSGRPR